MKSERNSDTGQKAFTFKTRSKYKNADKQLKRKIKKSQQDIIHVANHKLLHNAT